METKSDNKYMNGKIYSIRSYQTDKIYIGSTVQPLHKRLHKHRSQYKKYEEGKSTITSFEILKYDDNYIELLEEYACTNSNQLHRREGELIRQYANIAVNFRIEGRTVKEYMAEPEIKERYSVNRQKYYEKNYDHMNDQSKQYYTENKERILTARTENTYTCECGSSLTHVSKPRHNRSAKHLKYLSSIVA